LRWPYFAAISHYHLTGCESGRKEFVTPVMVLSHPADQRFWKHPHNTARAKLLDFLEIHNCGV